MTNSFSHLAPFIFQTAFFTLQRTNFLVYFTLDGSEGINAWDAATSCKWSNPLDLITAL